MTDITSAEARRREREWLHVEFDDAVRTAAFRQSVRALSATAADLEPLIAVGELRAARDLIPTLEDAAEFVTRFGEYFMASGDAAFARAMAARAASALEQARGRLAADALHALVAAAEAIADRTLAANSTAAIRAAGPRTHGTHPVCAFVRDELGYSPDAAKGRLRLQPVVERTLRLLNVDNIHIGDALVSLRVERSDVLRFTASQTSGAFPVRLILEPVLDFPVSRAFVDGKEADLEFRPHGERVIVPVQIVLDDQREVVLE